MSDAREPLLTGVPDETGEPPSNPNAPASGADGKRVKQKKNVRIASDSAQETQSSAAGSSASSTSKPTRTNQNNSSSGSASSSGKGKAAGGRRKTSYPALERPIVSVSVDIEAITSDEAAHEIRQMKSNGAKNGKAGGSTSDGRRAVASRAVGLDAAVDGPFSSSLKIEPRSSLVSINQSDGQQLSSSSSDLRAGTPSNSHFSRTPPVSPFLDSFSPGRSSAVRGSGAASLSKRSGSQANGLGPSPLLPAPAPTPSSNLDTPGRAEGARSKSFDVPSSNPKRDDDDDEDNLVRVPDHLRIPDRRSSGRVNADEPEFVVYSWRWYVLAMLTAVNSLSNMNWCVNLTCNCPHLTFRVDYSWSAEQNL